MQPPSAHAHEDSNPPPPTQTANSMNPSPHTNPTAALHHLYQQALFMQSTMQYPPYSYYPQQQQQQQQLYSYYPPSPPYSSTPFAYPSPPKHQPQSVTYPSPSPMYQSYPSSSTYQTATPTTPSYQSPFVQYPLNPPQLNPNSPTSPPVAPPYSHPSTRPHFPKPRQTPSLPVRCEPCDKSFPNERNRASHIQQHIQCAHCPFEASKRIVVEHERTAHSSAHAPSDLPAADKPFLRLMESPEEIARWREERRKKYPTNEVIQRKLREEEQLKANGGMTPQQMKQLKRKREVAFMNAFRKDDRRQKNKKVKEDRDSHEDPEDLTKDNQKDLKEEHDDDEDQPEEVGVSFKEHDRRQTRLCKHFMRGQCRRGQQCAFKHDMSGVSKTSGGITLKNDKKKSKVKSILMHLMDADIQREKETVFEAIQLMLRHDLKLPVAANDLPSRESDESISEKDSTETDVVEGTGSDDESSSNSDDHGSRSESDTESECNQEPNEDDEDGKE